MHKSSAGWQVACFVAVGLVAATVVDLGVSITEEVIVINSTWEEDVVVSAAGDVAASGVAEVVAGTDEEVKARTADVESSAIAVVVEGRSEVVVETMDEV
jgi:hypothetical protein